jgi:hypothetical protein
MQGVALTTTFTLGCANWIDSDEHYPLTYAFALRSSNSAQPIGLSSAGNESIEVRLTIHLPRKSLGCNASPSVHRQSVFLQLNSSAAGIL